MRPSKADSNVSGSMAAFENCRPVFAEGSERKVFRATQMEKAK